MTTFASGGTVWTVAGGGGSGVSGVAGGITSIIDAFKEGLE